MTINKDDKHNNSNVNNPSCQTQSLVAICEQNYHCRQCFFISSLSSKSSRRARCAMSWNDNGNDNKAIGAMAANRTQHQLPMMTTPTTLRPIFWWSVTADSPPTPSLTVKIVILSDMVVGKHQRNRITYSNFSMFCEAGPAASNPNFLAASIKRKPTSPNVAMRDAILIASVALPYEEHAINDKVIGDEII